MLYNYNKLWKRLIDHGLNMRSLAKEAGVSISTVARMKDKHIVSINTLQKIANALNCEITDLYEIEK